MKKSIQPERVRNIGIMAHIDAGKTTTTERILYYTGRVHKIGEVDDGAATMDWMSQEQERGITITSASTTCFWNVEETPYIFNIIDTPGHVDFTIEVERSLRILDGAITVICGVAGVQPQTETVWRQANFYKVPRLVFINKMDRIGANFLKAVESIKTQLQAKTIALQLPIGSEDNFEGVIDLLSMEAVYYDDSSLGANYIIKEIPKDYEEQAYIYRDQLLEIVSEYDDSILEKLLDDIEVSTSEIEKALREATLNNSLIPVLCGSSLKNKGVQKLLDAVAKYLPSPLDVSSIEGVNPKNGEVFSIVCSEEGPLCAVAFKIVNDPFAGQLTFVRVYSGSLKSGDAVYNSSKQKTEKTGQIVKMHSNKREDVGRLSAGDIGAVIGYSHTTTGDTLCSKSSPVILENTHFPAPVIDIAIEPKTKGDQEKLHQALECLVKEDPSFRYKLDEDTGQILISGMGELHLEITVDRLKKEFKVLCNVGKPRVSYRETITTHSEVNMNFDRSIGGKEQYAQFRILFEPLASGSGFVFKNMVNKEALPERFVLAIKQGIVDSLDSGVLAGYTLIDFKATITTGSYREESTEMAFRMAGSLSLRDGIRKAHPIILEPVMKVQITVPIEYTGEVIGDLNARKGKIRGMEEQYGTQFLTAEVPLAAMFGYSTDLRSATQGRAVYTMQFSQYEPISQNLFNEIVGNSQI